MGTDPALIAALVVLILAVIAAAMLTGEAWREVIDLDEQLTDTRERAEAAERDAQARIAELTAEVARRDIQLRHQTEQAARYRADLARALNPADDVAEPPMPSWGAKTLLDISRANPSDFNPGDPR